MVRIAISGKKNSGKDTLSRIISNYFSFSKIFSFADLIKEGVLALTPGLDREILWGPSQLRSTPLELCPEKQIRDTLTDMGKLFRSYNENWFIHYTLPKIKLWEKGLQSLQQVTSTDKFSSPAALISDVRFQNELKQVKEEGFFVIRILRPSHETNSTDPSEVELDQIPLDEFDAVIYNDGTLGELEGKVLELLKKNFK